MSARMSTPTDVYMDFETFCEANIKDVGAWRYSEDPSCEVLCLAYSFALDEEPYLWVPDWNEWPNLYSNPPADLMEAIAGGARVHAHNAMFEYAIWENVCRLHEPELWPRIRIEQLHCTMALVANYSYPLSLEEAGLAIGADFQKDKEGKRLLRKFAGPRRPTKANPRTRLFPWEDDEFMDLCMYCVQDVLTDMALLKRLPRQELTERERKVYELDFRMNVRGVKIDVETAKHIKGLAEEMSETMEKEVVKLTGGLKSSQRAKILDWAAVNGYPMENYQAEYVASCAADERCPPTVRRVLQIRSEMGKTSVTKYSKMIECAGSGDRARGMVQYYGAQRTGRFAGRLIQVHNLPRGNIKGIHLIADFARDLDLDDFKLLYERPMDAFSSMIRSMIIAELNRVLCVTDFANIEGRVLAWMAQQMDLVRQFASGDDVYKHMAATIFHTPYQEVDDDQRFVGKQAVLGCGYGMGGPKFQATCIGYGQDIGFGLALATVKAYRKKNHKIVAAWYAVDDAVTNAILNPGITTRAFMCEFRVQGRFLMVRLPSTRTLKYESPRIEDGQITYNGVDQFSGQWKRISTYGGKTVENIVQGVARDILVDAMIRVEERSEYWMLMTVHDELAAGADENLESIAEFNEIVREVPLWATGCPIEVEGWMGSRYRK